MPERDTKSSSTITVTSDGRTIVDIRRVMGKQHMRDTIREIRDKTVVRSGTPRISTPQQVKKA